jgi:hypothetical protein
LPKNRPFVGCLHQAYVAILHARRSEDGTRTISLARYGEFEVRLIELQEHCSRDDSQSWLELYRHDTQSSVDSYRCDELDEAETAAKHLISSARELADIKPDSYAMAAKFHRPVRRVGAQSTPEVPRGLVERVG